MAIGGAFLGGGVEVVPAGSCKLELEILTEDRANLTATFTIKGTSTYTVTAGADGRAVYTVPAGQTYTVSVNTTGYDNIASQTVIAESGTVRYVRFEAFAGRVKRSGDTMTGTLAFAGGASIDTNGQVIGKKLRTTADIHLGSSPSSYAVINDGWIQNRTIDETKADLGINDKVGKSGNETIAGAKTFEGVIILRNDSVKAITFNKADGTTIGWSQIDGNNNMEHTCILGNLTLSAPNGRVYSTTTPSDATSNEIATANWSIGKFVQKSGDTMSGLLHLTGGCLLSTTPDKAVTDVPIFSTMREIDVSSVNSYQVAGSINMHWSGWKYSGGMSNWRDATFTAMNIIADSSAGSQTILTVWQPNDGNQGWVSCPSWSPGTNDNSNKILTIKMANSLPSLVHTTGNETIAGSKRFSQGLIRQHGAISAGSVPTSDQYVPVVNIQDSSGTDFGYIRYFAGANSKLRLLQIEVNKLNDDGSTPENSFLQLFAEDENGPARATAPTTPTNASGTEIVTANWAYDKFQRKITYGTGDPPSGGQAGDIYIKI